MSSSPSSSGQKANQPEIKPPNLVPWFANSPFFDARCMSATTLQKLQQSLHFVNGNLHVLKRTDTELSLRKYNLDEEQGDRNKFLLEVVEADPELTVFLLSHVFEHHSPDGIDPRKQGVMRFSISLSQDNFQWLMDTIHIHPLFLECLHSHFGHYATYETFGQESDDPTHLHLLVKAPPAGHLEAAFYVLYEYATQKLVVIVAGNDLDAQLEQLASHLKPSAPPFDPFTIVLSLVTRYYWFLETQKVQVDHAVIMTERETGRGAVVYSDGQRSHAISPDKFDLTFMHWIEGNQRQTVRASRFQAQLAQFLVEQHTRHLERTQQQRAHGKQSKITTTTLLQDFELNPTQRTLHSRLLSHLSMCDGLYSDSLVIRERIQRQLSAADSIINQYENKVSLSNAEANTSIAEQSRRIADESKAIAAETRRDSTSMKTIASLTMVYLPSTFAASVFSTGFFSYSGDGTELVKVNPQIWKLFVVAISLSIVTVGVWVWLNKSGIPSWLDWARQRQSARMGKENNVDVNARPLNTDTQQQPVNLDTLRARLNRPPLEVVSAPKINLPV